MTDETCAIHDWPTEGMATRLVQAIREQHGKSGVNACRECLDRAKADAGKALDARIAARFGFGTNPAVQSHDLSPDDPDAVAARTLGDTFTNGMEILRDKFPNLRINDVAAMAYAIIGEQLHADVALAEVSVPTLAVALLVVNGQPRARIFLPDDWLEMVQKEPLVQLGALVFAASQVVDVYNGRIVPEENFKRGKAYLAEYLLTLWRMEQITLTDHQEKTLQEYPQGLETPALADLLYDPKAAPLPYAATPQANGS